MLPGIIVRAVISAGVLASSVAIAQPAVDVFPSRPVRVIVPYAPGGGTDIVARLIGARLHEALGRPVVVENRAGGSGTLGTDLVTKAPADGHTLLVTNVGLAFNATLFPRLPFDTVRDLAPVSLVANQPNVLVVHPSLPVRSARELFALARSKPGALSYASGGNGSGSHLAAELLKLETRTAIAHIPYKGLGPALTEVAGGHVQIAVATLSPALPLIQAGRLRALAVTTSTKSPMLPDVPTLAAAGVPGFEFSTWHGLFAPGSTPKPIVERLSDEIRVILTSGVMQERYASQGLEVAYNPPDKFAAQLRDEIGKWGEVVRVAKVKMD